MSTDTCRLAWRRQGPLWIPSIDADATIDDLTELLFDRCKSNPLNGCERALKLTIENWLALPSEWSAAVGAENEDGFVVSPMIAIRGGGHQFPVPTIDKINAELAVDDMRSALVGPWMRRPKFGFRWEPTEWQEHGGQWIDPSKDPAQVARGSTRLAIEGLPLVPSLSPTHHATCRERKHTRVEWPVWQEWLSPAAVRGRIIAGVGDQLWQCDRIHTGQAQYSFSAARPLLVAVHPR